MFKRLAKLILRNRFLLLTIISIITVIMGWQATHIQLSYEFAKILPASDPDFQAYQHFKEKFGEDGSVMFIGIQDSSMRSLKNYNAWWKLGEDIRKIDGIEAVISTARLYNLQRNDSLQKFEMKLLQDGPAGSQAQLDTILDRIEALPFYDGFIFNKDSHASLMAVTFDKVKLNSKNRIEIVRTIQAQAIAFSKQTGVAVHLSGMPFIRTEITSKVVQEMKLFMLLAVLVTAIVLFVFFRSFQVVFYSLIVVAVGVIWSLGKIGRAHV